VVDPPTGATPNLIRVGVWQRPPVDAGAQAQVRVPDATFIVANQSLKITNALADFSVTLYGRNLPTHQRTFQSETQIRFEIVIELPKIVILPAEPFDLGSLRDAVDFLVKIAKLFANLDLGPVLHRGLDIIENLVDKLGDVLDTFNVLDMGVVQIAFAFDLPQRRIKFTDVKIYVFVGNTIVEYVEDFFHDFFLKHVLHVGYIKQWLIDRFGDKLSTQLPDAWDIRMAKLRFDKKSRTMSLDIEAQVNDWNDEKIDS